MIHLFGGVDESLRVLYGRHRQDAVSEIQDVTMTAAFGQQRLRLFGDDLWRREQHARIEVALQREAVADTLARVLQVDAPIQAQHVRAATRHLFEEGAAAVDVHYGRRGLAV